MTGNRRDPESALQWVLHESGGSPLKSPGPKIVPRILGAQPVFDG